MGGTTDREALEAAEAYLDGVADALADRLMSPYAAIQCIRAECERIRRHLEQTAPKNV